jgi:hypothetical protein
MQQVSTQDNDNGVVEVLDPKLAINILSRAPQEHATQEPGKTHGSHGMTDESLHSTTRLDDEFILRHHCQNAHEKACHPRTVAKNMVMVVSMHKRANNEATQRNSTNRKDVIQIVICEAPRAKHFAEKPQSKDQRGNVHHLVQPIA